MFPHIPDEVEEIIILEPVVVIDHNSRIVGVVEVEELLQLIKS